MKKISTILLISVLLVSCSNEIKVKVNETERNFTEIANVGVYSLDGSFSYEYGDDIQMSINNQKFIFRLQESDLSSYVNIQFQSAFNAAGETVEPIFDKKNITIDFANQKFTVAKIDAGKVWLSSEKIGIVLPMFNN